MIHQHPTVFPDLSVAENVFVGRQPMQRGPDRLGGDARRGAANCSRVCAWRSTSALPVKMLSIAERQTIEIVRALSLDARVLVMDEPTSAISGREVDRLFEIVLRLKQQGVAILFISHFIDEILRMGDDVTILRSGRRVVTCPTAELTPEQTVRHMIGTDLAAFFPKEAAEIGAPVLERARPVRRRVRRGRELRSARGRDPGLLRSGRRRPLRGRRRCCSASPGPTSGEIRSTARTVRPALAAAMPCSSASRSCPRTATTRGSCSQFPIRANETLPVLRRLADRLGLVDRRAEAKLAEDFAGRMRVVATGIEQLTNTLSGGNQQKVLLAKWLIPAPRVLILDQPTRGIDVGAKAEIHRIVSHLATEGIAIILIGDDAAEVMRDGRSHPRLSRRPGRGRVRARLLRSGGDAARRRACRARPRRVDRSAGRP